jgi:starch-binding outer membrane protein, SusD/RagB family
LDFNYLIIHKKMKMKYRILQFSALILSALLIITGCEKTIDKIQPEFQINREQPLKTLEEAENVLTGAYNGFLADGYYSCNGLNGSGAFNFLPDIMGDDLIETLESLGNYRRHAEWTYTKDDPWVTNAWNDVFVVLAPVNIMLKEIEPLAGDVRIKNRLKGQALAIRAHVHFDMLRIWGVSLNRNSTELGIPYIKTYDVNGQPARLTVKESYDNILADLSAAKALLGNIDKPINSSDKRSYIDLIGVNAITARVHFYAGEFNAAAVAAQEVINAMPLATIDEFPDIWKDESVAEVIWSPVFESAADGYTYENAFFARGNRSSYRPTSDLLALYGTNDVRPFSYFGNIGGRTVVTKYLGKKTATDGLVNWKAYRVAEMYLILAESKFSTDENAALSALDELRSNRITGYTSNGETGSALLNAIRLERRKEMAFEGYRFYEFKRLGNQPITRAGCGIGSLSTICNLSSTSRSWAWPVPENEILANRNMVQNPGY